MTGVILVNHTDDAIRCTSDDKRIRLQAGTSYKNNSWLEMRGKDMADNPGDIGLHARNASDASSLVLRPNGELKWRGNDVITSAGGTMWGTIRTTNGNPFVIQNPNVSISDTSREEEYYDHPFVIEDKDGKQGAAFELTWATDGSRYAHTIMRNRDDTEWIRAGLVEEPNGRVYFHCRRSEALLPVGAVFAFAGNTTPVGCLLCNGGAVSRTSYKYLFEAIGTTYGEGDGSTTFNLPNLTDRFIQGSGTVGTVMAAGAPEIGGQFGQTFIVNSLVSNGCFAHIPNGSTNVGTSSPSPLSCGYFSFSAQRSSPIYGNSNTIQPPALTMRYYIKY